MVAAYLDQRCIPWEHEPAVGGRHLDFVARTVSGPVALEVYEPRLTLPNRAGSFDPIAPVEGLFSDRKRKQIKAAKDAGLPLILVVGSANSDVPYDIFSMAGVMFGRPGVRMTVGPEGTASEPEAAFLGPGKVQAAVNRGVSAVALVRRFNPTLWRLHAAWRSVGLMGRPPATTARDRCEVIGRMHQIETAMTESGAYQPDARLGRLVLATNPFALKPLPPTFAGPHDDLYGSVGETGWGLTATGRLRREVADD